MFLISLSVLDCWLVHSKDMQLVESPAANSSHKFRIIASYCQDYAFEIQNVQLMLCLIHCCCRLLTGVFVTCCGFSLEVHGPPGPARSHYGPKRLSFWWNHDRVDVFREQTPKCLFWGKFGFSDIYYFNRELVYVHFLEVRM